MPRKKKNAEEKSTVIKIRDDFDWGKILYDACYMFNRGFADYLIKYSKKYDNGEISFSNADSDVESLSSKRNEIIKEKERLHALTRDATVSKIGNFRKYAKSLPIGSAVSQWRKSISVDCNSNDIDAYNELINKRKALKEQYHVSLLTERSAISNERKHIDSHLFMTRTINHQINNISKMVEKHNMSINHSMSDDVKKIYDVIVSDGQTERLMAVCLSILNTYSEKEFSTMMSVLDRERIAENIYDFFSKFEHNYDFISGCYDINDEKNTLELKPIDVLQKKIYNGYYFTIRGYVQRSYSDVRFEKFNIDSSDGYWKEDTSNGNHGIDSKKNIVDDNGLSSGVPISNTDLIDDSTKECWDDCTHFLYDNIQDISEELAEKLSEKFPKNSYYNSEKTVSIMRRMIEETLAGISEEFSMGNTIGNKFKHIVLDSMGGAETNDEWRQNVSVLSGIISKYIREFFEKERNDYKHAYSNKKFYN